MSCQVNCDEQRKELEGRLAHALSELEMERERRVTNADIAQWADRIALAERRLAQAQKTIEELRGLKGLRESAYQREWYREQADLRTRQELALVSAERAAFADVLTRLRGPVEQLLADCAREELPREVWWHIRYLESAWLTGEHLLPVAGAKP